MTTIVTRSGKGSPLTNNEMDTNLTNLNNFKVEQTEATGAAAIPTGTTAQRPTTPVDGYIRYNITLQDYEGYKNGNWLPLGGGAQFSFRNKIINGKMEIAQRGTSGTGANTYTLDRWILFHAGTAPTWARVSGGTIDDVYFSNLIEIVGASGNTGVNFNQRIESRNSADLCGKTVTFSAYVLHTNTGGPRNFVIAAQRPNTADNWSGVTSVGISGNISVPLNVWTRITWTTTLPASGPNLGLSFEILCGALGATQGVYVTGVQLEAGSIATPFEHRPYGMELSLCQWYFRRYRASFEFGEFFTGASTSTTGSKYAFELSGGMRAAPTLSASGSFLVDSAGSREASVSLGGATPNTVAIYATVSGGQVNGNCATLQANNDANAFIDLASEL